MADLTAALELRKRLSRTQSFQIVDAATLQNGSYAALASTGDATAGARGRIRPYGGTNNDIPLGLVIAEDDVNRTGVTGDTAATPIPEATVQLEALTVVNVPVTGASSVNDCVGLPVFLADTDNVGADLTLTGSLNGTPVGWVIQYRDGSNCDVELFSSQTMRAIEAAGGLTKTVHVGVITGNLAASTTVINDIGIFSHYSIDAVYLTVIEPLVGAGADIDINIDIDGTNLTGGVIPWLLADGIGTRKNGSAITANNIAHEASGVDVEATVNTASTGGLANLYFQITHRFGL